MTDVVAYTPARDGECLALEAACVHGRAFRLRFRRPAFHVRSESYADWRIFLAEEQGQVIGSMAVAFKQVVERGEPRRAGFAYDLRVHPAHRGRGVAKRLSARIIQEAEAEGAGLLYTYVLGDNRAPAALASLFDGRPAGGYRQLAWPVYGPWGAEGEVTEVDARSVHEEYLAAEGPFDLYTSPFAAGALQGHVGSWRVDGAAGSAWSNAGILEEVVERLPLPLRVLGGATRAWPLRLRPWPAVPQRGASVRSWILFDVSARDGAAARRLLAHVNDLALQAGIDWIYVLSVPGGGSWPAALRVTRLFSPVIPFSLLVRGARDDAPLRPYVDVRDL